jgi:hypothetical protein
VTMKTPTTSLTIKLALTLLSPVSALAYGVDLLVALEGSGAGAQWSLLGFRPDGINGLSLGWILGLLVLQIVLYTVLAWWLEQILPSQYGTRQRPCFLCTRTYWKIHSRRSVAPGDASTGLLAPSETPITESNPAVLGGSSLPGGEPTQIEAVADELRALGKSQKCIETKFLRKEFSTPDGVLVAVNNLCLTMYEGQIFALLGHNGVSNCCLPCALFASVPVPTAERAPLDTVPVFATRT